MFIVRRMARKGKIAITRQVVRRTKIPGRAKITKRMMTKKTKMRTMTKRAQKRTGRASRTARTARTARMARMTKRLTSA